MVHTMDGWRTLASYALLGCLWVISCPPAVAQRAEVENTSDAEALAEEVRQLIAQLGDPNYHRRMSAEWQLQRMGLAAFEQLRIAANTHEDIQIANSARYIIESQNIVWWLETDSVEVRGYLAGYSAAEKDQREGRILALASLDKPDAWLALCRLARYERHEDLSRTAALALMEAVGRKEQVSETLAQSIVMEIGNSDRVATQWLRQLVDDLTSPSAQTLRNWKTLVEAERERPRVEDRGENLAQRQRFLKWVGVWLTRTSGRDQALEAIRPSFLDLVGNTLSELQGFSLWALDEGMPELVQHLAHRDSSAQSEPDSPAESPLNAYFEQNADLGYLLAESYLKLGDDETARRIAESASEKVGPNEDTRKLSNQLRITGLIANSRLQLARRLSLRGLFDWAETEYLKALAENSKNFDAEIRESLAMFYWFGGENPKAAEVLRPLAEELEKQETPRQLNSPFATNREGLLAAYYFYDGLAKIDLEDEAGARESLRKAFEADATNPDIVIAMKRVANTQEYREFYDDCFGKMLDRFRLLVVTYEERMAHAADRDRRRNAEASLARSCNQLAWLLAKCETHKEEAVHLSQRSLELQPDESIYLDTLARCYFSAGDIGLAITTQKKAISLSPHERQMAAQLEEFELARQSAEEDTAQESP